MTTPEWQAKIDAAQKQTTVELRGARYRRIPYGEEDEALPYPQCPDCACARGQLHVEACDQQQCPRCDGKALSCDCADESVPGPH